MENPSLRVSRHGGSTSRTFTVEDYVEDEFGLWAIDEATTLLNKHRDGSPSQLVKQGYTDFPAKTKKTPLLQHTP